MAKVTVFSAAPLLGATHQSLGKLIHKGKISCERVGRFHILEDLDVTRQELELAGYYEHRAAWKRAAQKRAAQQGQAV